MTPAESLYIHWPFCTSKCYYCDFVALEQHEDFQIDYHHAILKEIVSYADSFPAPIPIKTIFIGGGTPSLWPLELMTELFTTLHSRFDLSNTCEITMEANPADVTEDRADHWESLGINRISCGVQVLDDTVLQRLNRRQRITDVKNAIKILPKYFKNVSMDLIIGLPGVSDEAWANTIETISSAPIQHISLYFLTIHEKTPLYYKLEKGELSLPEENRMLEQYATTVDLFARRGFKQYEVSNFALPGYESRHNIGYWHRIPYKGFGIGAASFDGSERTVNQKNLTKYLDNSSNKAFSFFEKETLAPDQIKLEKLMLSLRLTKGMPLNDIIACLGAEKKIALLASLHELEAAGLLHLENDHVRLTLRGMILENEVVLRLI